MKLKHANWFLKHKHRRTHHLIKADSPGFGVSRAADAAAARDVADDEIVGDDVLSCPLLFMKV